MLRWIPFPFIRYCLFLISGILVSNWNEDFVINPGFLIILCTAYFILLVGTFRLKKKIFSLIYGIWGLSIWFLIGIALPSNYSIMGNPDHFQKFSRIKAYVGIAAESPRERKNSVLFKVRITHILLDSQWVRSTGNVMVNWNKPDTLPEPGLQLLISGTPRIIRPPVNPGQFDYQSWMADQNIFHQHYVKSDQVIVSVGGIESSLFSWSNRIRSAALRLLDNHMRSSKERGVVKALVIGSKKNIDTEIRDIFAGTGAMHVLAVSGLHVGIIYMIISVLLGQLKKSVPGRAIYAVTSVFMLFIYAMLTGLSPSVLRAALMFSFIIIAESLNRRSNVYNTIAASALLLLLFNPFLIRSVSFQLSYLAVTGIVYFYPKVYRLFYTRFWLLDKIWAITSVSIAAQIATFPIVIFYFNQFPTYGLLSNLIVIPAAFVILLGSMCAMFLTLVTDWFSWTFSLIEWIVFSLNWLLEVINQFPNAQIEFPLTGLDEVFVIYAVLISIIALFETKRFLYVIFLAGSLLFYSVFSTQEIIVSRSQNKLIFYQSYSFTVIHHLSSSSNIIWTDAEPDNPQLQRLFRDSGKHYRILSMPEFRPIDSVQFISVSNKIIGIIDKPHLLRKDSIKIPVDYLLLTRNSRGQGGEHFEFKYLVNHIHGRGQSGIRGRAVVFDLNDK